MALPGEEIPERCHWQHAFDAWEVFLRKFGGRASLDLHGIFSKGSQSWRVENMNVLVLVEQVHLHDVTVVSQLSQAPAAFFPPTRPRPVPCRPFMLQISCCSDSEMNAMYSISFRPCWLSIPRSSIPLRDCEGVPRPREPQHEKKTRGTYQHWATQQWDPLPQKDQSLWFPRPFWIPKWPTGWRVGFAYEWRVSTRPNFGMTLSGSQFFPKIRQFSAISCCFRPHCGVPKKSEQPTKWTSSFQHVQFRSSNPPNPEKHTPQAQPPPPQPPPRPGHVAPTWWLRAGVASRCTRGSCAARGAADAWPRTCAAWPVGRAPDAAPSSCGTGDGGMGTWDEIGKMGSRWSPMEGKKGEKWEIGRA